jgi:hypothetical protein
MRIQNDSVPKQRVQKWTPLLGGASITKQFSAMADTGALYETPLVGTAERVKFRMRRELRNNENLTRVRIFGFAPRRITRHVNISTVWIERAIDITRFSRHRLGIRNL